MRLVARVRMLKLFIRLPATAPEADVECLMAKTLVFPILEEQHFCCLAESCEDGGCTLQLVYRRIDTTTTTTTTTTPCRLYKQRTTVEPLAATAIAALLLLCFKPPHPREPLRGLIEGGVAGFYMVL